MWCSHIFFFLKDYLWTMTKKEVIEEEENGGQGQGLIHGGYQPQKELTDGGRVVSTMGSGVAHGFR